ncbi:MAG: hypothetical protein ACOCVR_04215, partial [Myxococcota bacterium]
CDIAEGACQDPPPGESGLGESCGDDLGICVFGLVCVGHGSDPRCMETCDLAEGPLCESGAVCYEARTPEGGVCWLGGELGLDSPCSGEFDCAAGLLCATHVSGTTCRPACDMQAEEPCAEGTGSCQPVDGRLGVCLP